MNCKEAKNMMMGYLDKDIAKDEELILHEHLGSCELCLEEFELLLEIGESLHNLPLLEPGEDFVQSVMDKIDLSMYGVAKVEDEPSQNTIEDIDYNYKGILIFMSIFGIAILAMKTMKDIISGLVFDVINTISYSAWFKFLEMKLLNPIMNAITHPGRMLISFLKYLGELPEAYIIVYGVALLSLLIVLGMIQATLFKIVKKDWGYRHETITME